MRKPRPDTSAFNSAEPAFLREILDIGGGLLAQMTTEMDSMAILQDLCGAMRDLLDATSVDLVVTVEADEFGTHWSVTADRPATVGPMSEPAADHPDDPLRHCQADITSLSGEVIADLRASWPPGSGHPTELDQLVVTRFATMSFVIVERHLAQRRQMQAIIRDREMTAGEIHDDPIQTMTAVSLRLQRLSNSLADGEQRASIDALRSLTDDAIERLRHVMFSLYPETLIEDGLAAAIEAYCETYVEPEGLATTIEDVEETVLPTDLAMIGFRLARNAIANVVRHARASSMTISIEATDRRLEIRVTDDGVGFDVNSLNHTAVGHFGIPHAQTLAHWAGGSYRTESEPDRGTEVTINLPIR